MSLVATSLTKVLNSFHLNYLVRTIDCDSRQTRRLLLQQSIPIYCIPQSEGNFDAFSQVLKECYEHLPYDFKELSSTEKQMMENTRREEFFELYKPSEYDPALNDIQLDLLPRVISSFMLQQSDTLVDLGSSTGRLIMASRLLTNCENCVGVELSPSRTHASVVAANRLQKIDGYTASSSSSNISSQLEGFISKKIDNLSFQCGDITSPQKIAVGNVYFLGTGRSGRKQLIPKVLRSIVDAHVILGSPVCKARVICAGFTLPQLKGIKPICGVTFPTSISLDKDVFGMFDDNSREPVANDELGKYSKFYEPCYGDTMGPRVLIHFEIDLEQLSSSLS